jgi:hypothetical protein
LLGLRKAVFPKIPEISEPSEADGKSAVAALHKAQTILKNPVVLALHHIDLSQPDTDKHSTDRLRIANEILQHLGWSNAAASNSSDGTAMWAIREQCSREQVSRTRAELEAYLDQKEASLAHHPGRETLRPSDMNLQNPVLAALAGRRN